MTTAILLIRRLSLALCAGLAVQGAIAAEPARSADADAQAKYQRERAACMNGQTTNEDRATCLREAGAALAEARKRQPDHGEGSCARTRRIAARC